MNVVLPLLIVAAALGTPAGSGTVEGRWVLVEQTYGSGANNLADAERPLHVEFRRGPAGLGGRLWAGDDPADAVTWPAFRAERELAPPRILEREEDPAGGAVRVRYRVEVEPESGFEIEVTESYRLSGDGALTGTMTVRFFTPEGDRGSYELRRRFQRVR